MTYAAMGAAKATAPHAIASALDVVSTGGLLIPAQWAAKKLINRARGYGVATVRHPRWGVMEITGKFRTLDHDVHIRSGGRIVTIPKGWRVPLRIEKMAVVKPSLYYRRQKLFLERQRAMRRAAA
jgi:hypothetical protein